MMWSLVLLVESIGHNVVETDRKKEAWMQTEDSRMERKMRSVQGREKKEEEDKDLQTKAN